MKRLQLLQSIRENEEVHPITALLGPRQAGKTTLARMYAEQYYPNNYYFFDLENINDLERLKNALFTLRLISQKLIVIDEIQRLPELFVALRVFVDEQKDNHKILILGSASRELIKQSSESLAGRIGYKDVMPFSTQETGEYHTLWLRGGFPLSYLAQTDDKSVWWRKNYISTFLEQDIPNLGFSIPPQHMRRFWMMLAHYHGNIFNASEIGRALGISHHTVQKYVSILTGTFMIRILDPWFENIAKRQVKSPKLYFRDSGILHTLLSIENETMLFHNPKIGASWEGFALEETIRMLDITAQECFFWSTHADAEIDLYVLKKGKKIGFEYKYAETPKVTKSMHSALDALSLDKLYIVVPGDALYALNEKITVVGLVCLSSLISFH